MSRLLGNASLLLNPAGAAIAYKEGKINSVLPNNGAGDFTFSGGDGGTRVNQQGYVEVTPANLVGYSEDLSADGWGKVNISVSYNSIANPITGQINAPLCTVTNPNANIEKTLTTTNIPVFKPSTTYTMSGYVKAGSITSVFRLLAYDGNTLFVGPNINLSSSNIGNNGNYQYIKDGWYRVWYTFTTSAGATTGYIYPVNYNFGSTITTGTNIYFFGAMMNEGSSPKPYQPTTNRLNYPRITYQNGRGALLSEPQRTNLYVGSQNFSIAYNKYQITLTANAAISPDGTQNATKFVDNTASSTHQIEPNFSATSGVTYTMSVFVKAAEYTQFHIFAFADNGVFNSTDAVYDIVAGTVISGTGASIEKWPNGWFRCIRTMTAGATGTGYWGIGAAKNGNSNYTGDGSSGVYVWGAQNEAGEFASTYIPTTSATVTRPQDTTKNSSASSVIGQTEGVLYTDFTFDPLKGATDFLVLTVSNGTTANNIFLDIFNNTVVFGVDSSSSRVVQLQSGTITPGRHKMAGGYKNNDFAFYLDGELIGTDAAGSVPACSVVDVGLWANGNFPFAGNLNTVALFNTRLTNTQLAELTTVRSGSGGTISYYGPYTIHTFTGSATFTPSFSGEVEVLVVAGGGSGAAGWGNGGGMGGGGAGGLLYASSFGVSQGTGITVTIGAGGAGTTGTTQAGRNGTLRGNPGSNTSFGGLTAIGGGGGAGDGATTATMTGGSGGGGGYASISTGGAGIPGQGNNGGNHSNSNGFPNNYCGGGGGGAGVVGTPGTTAGGNGGNGLPYSISGFSTYYAGGGGGGTYASSGPGGAGVGGLGGGGNGGIGSVNPGQNGTAGVNFTGGAGGAGGCPGGSGNTGGNGGAGGSGIVIVRYLT